MIETTYRSAELVYRAGEDGAADVLEGRMAPYGEWTEIRSAVEGHFIERLAPGSLAKTLVEKAGKLKVLFEHGFSRSLDRAPIGLVMEAAETQDGAHYRANLFRNIPPIIRDGIMEGAYGTSVALRNVKVDVVRSPKKSEYNPQGLPEHTIREAALKEISVVTFPAYEGATAGLARSVTDDVLGELLIPFLTRERPEFLLSLARQSAEVEPSHSEPDQSEEPPADEPAEPAEPQEDEAPAEDEASRSTPPKPKKDWLSETEVKPEWRL